MGESVMASLLKMHRKATFLGVACLTFILILWSRYSIDDIVTRSIPKC